MENFDWVTFKQGCSLARAFERLKTQCETDVETRTALLNDETTVFKVETLKADKFLVSIECRLGYASVTFSRTPPATVSVHRHDGTVLVEGTLVLGDDQECKLRVEGQELAFWAIPMACFGGFTVWVEHLVSTVLWQRPPNLTARHLWPRSRLSR